MRTYGDSVDSKVASTSLFRLNRCFGSRINFERMTIHGLWPNTNPQYPNKLAEPGPNLLQYCNLSSQLIASDLSPPSFTASLEQNWPSLTNYQVRGEPLRFWNREWRKHGTCSNYSKLNYFRLALNIYRSLNPDLILTNFPPSSTVSYKVQDIRTYHTRRNFRQPYISCKTVAQVVYLVEIMYCLNPAANRFEDCTTYYNNDNNCGSGDLYILPM